MNLKILGIILVTMCILFSSNSSSNRIISSSTDNIYIKIRDSNGNFWDASADNIQVAINSLNNQSGTVFLPGNRTFYLTDTIVVWENVVLNMCGSEFRLPEGVDCDVVELKNRAEIKYGVINVAGHQAHGTSERQCTSDSCYITNTSFNISHSAIFLNASSCIDGAVIDTMYLDSICVDYPRTVAEVNDPPYDDPHHLGRGYGIYLYASNNSVPQWIRNVTARFLHFRQFHTCIYMRNERNPSSGEHGATISDNTFEYGWFDGHSYGVNITRAVDSDKCSVSRNYFDMVAFQTGRGGGYWGGGNITRECLNISGYANHFVNIFNWDWSGCIGYLNGNAPFCFRSDSSCCFLSGTGYLTYNNTNGVLDYGSKNTVFAFASGAEIAIHDLIEYNP